MLDIIKFIVEQFAEKKDLVTYDYVDSGETVNVVITLDASDMGKVIGRQGKLAKSLRTILKAVAQKENKTIEIKIQEHEAK